MADDASEREGRWRMIVGVLLGVIGLALIIIDLWADSLPDWLVDDASDDD